MSERPVGSVRRPAVVVMARSPSAAPDTVKTRLRPTVPDGRSRLALYEAFLADTLQMAREACARATPRAMLFVFHTPEGGPAGFERLGVDAGTLKPQRSGDLGARELGIFADVFALGHDAAVVIGSDFPTLPSSHVVDAIAALSRDPDRLVLGPADDGGYYLIGLGAPAVTGRRAIPDVFTGVRWSTANTRADTEALARAHHLEVSLVGGWFDVDDEVGWRQLIASVAGLADATRAPATRAVLTRLGVLPSTSTS
ncbi:MAG: TIGR04282 family arsenosugar biosynthesis glycosyltransferase [Vicinamibacterales bacterium]